MKFKLILILFLLLTSCKQYDTNKSHKLKNKIDQKFKNSGFTLVYNETLNIKKLDQRSFKIYQRNLKNKSSVKITNPINNKSLIAEVKSNNIKYSNFYNSIITTRIAEELELDLNEPYIEIVLITKNNTFVAKKAKTFEEEKKVAEKAPIDGIKISDLSQTVVKDKKIALNDKFSYSIKVADFYYKKSAQMMISKIRSKIRLKNLKIQQLSQTNYRVLIGPFNDIKSLKESFEKINTLYFENLEILKNV
ncbi:hypothetical protein OA107_01645 [Candidatus Pelagibacter sp.]|nr:hypothetical protein [Candidatus Pelagibacter sp.]